MPTVLKTTIVTTVILLLTTLCITACSGAPETRHDPYNSPDAQRHRAKQTQGELSRETSK